MITTSFISYRRLYSCMIGRLSQDIPKWSKMGIRGDTYHLINYDRYHLADAATHSVKSSEISWGGSPLVTCRTSRLETPCEGSWNRKRERSTELGWPFLEDPPSSSWLNRKISRLFRFPAWLTFAHVFSFQPRIGHSRRRCVCIHKRTVVVRTIHHHLLTRHAAQSC